MNVLPKVSVASRAHRALRGINRFKFTGEVPIELVEQAREHGELIGAYENPSGIEPQYIVVTDRGLGCVGSTSARWISFDDIEMTRGPREKLVDDAITVVLKSGIHTQLRVAGRDERFQDVLSFVRFLDRVTGDRRSSG